MELIIYVFNNIIGHINAVCLTANSYNSRLPHLYDYIFGFVSGPFSEDISNNLCFICNYANKDTIKYGTNLIKDIKKEYHAWNKNKRKDKKYWFAFDSLIIN